MTLHVTQSELLADMPQKVFLVLGFSSPSRSHLFASRCEGGSNACAHAYNLNAFSLYKSHQHSIDRADGDVRNWRVCFVSDVIEVTDKEREPAGLWSIVNSPVDLVTYCVPTFGQRTTTRVMKRVHYSTHLYFFLSTNKFDDASRRRNLIVRRYLIRRIEEIKPNMGVSN